MIGWSKSYNYLKLRKPKHRSRHAEPTGDYLKIPQNFNTSK